MGLPLFAPLFALGKTSSTAVTSFGTAGGRTTVLVAGDLTATFPAGTHVFTSGAGGSNVEYLGKVMTAGHSGGTTTLTVQIVRRFSYSTGFVWKPTSTWQSGLPGVAGRSQAIGSGVELVETTGGVPIRKQVAEEQEVARFAFGSVPASEWRDYKTWLRTTVSGRLGVWACAWWDLDEGVVRCCKVCDGMADRPLEAATVAYSLRSFVCEVVVIGESAYVA